MIKEFIANNYMEEVIYDPEDGDALLLGGSVSVVSKTAKEFEVDVSVQRNNHVVVVRGPKEKVLAAKKRLNQFLHGSDGYSVSKLVVSEQAVGFRRPTIGFQSHRRCHRPGNREAGRPRW